MQKKPYLFLLFFLILMPLFPHFQTIENHGQVLVRDLLALSHIQEKNEDAIPVSYNHALQGGYLQMPSARVGAEGELSFGYAYVHPYKHYNIRFQFNDRLEIIGNYRIFKGLDDPVLTKHGFGDFSDKGVSLKCVLLAPEESDYKLPGFAIGVDDFLGTKGFESEYGVATYLNPHYGFEFTLGFGVNRIQGFFGGACWMPWHRRSVWFFKDLQLHIEYDAIDYADPLREKHPNGRDQQSHINYGAKYLCGKNFGLSIAKVRGNHTAFSAYTAYNFGHTEGIVAKIDSPLPLAETADHRELGLTRNEDIFADQLTNAAEQQGFHLRSVSFRKTSKGNSQLLIRLINRWYWNEVDAKEQIIYLIAALVPENIDKISVTLEEKGLPIHSYTFQTNSLIDFREKKIGYYALDIISPKQEAILKKDGDRKIYFKPNRLAKGHATPRTRTLFGSSQGKFKASLGVGFGFEGYLADRVLYRVHLGYPVYNCLKEAQDTDMLNPSQLINVRSDTISYLKPKKISLVEGFLQKHWNMGKGFFSRVCGGYFEEAYGGIAAEILYYPVDTPFAIGLEGVVVKKREFTGLCFTDQIRRLDGFTPVYEDFLGKQLLLDIYTDLFDGAFEFKFSLGRFLAKDWGVKFEVAKNFKSGLQISFWTTITNAKDFVNHQRYYDKGVSFSMPIDMFFTYRTKQRYGYGIAAWLRDTGARSDAGYRLHQLIHNERYPFRP